MTYQFDPKLKALFDNMPGMWGCKDKDSTYMYVNEEAGKTVGMKHHYELIGQTDYDLACEAANCAPLFQAQDKAVISSRQRMRILDIHPYANGEWRAFLCTKTPLVDHLDDVVGVIFQSNEITNATILELGSILSKLSMKDTQSALLVQNSYMLVNPLDKLNLSQRQGEMLFYILRGKTIKQIAVLWGISHRTVEDYLEQLKNKFNVANKNELIDKAINLGYLTSIPESLLCKKQLSLILEE